LLGLEGGGVKRRRTGHNVTPVNMREYVANRTFVPPAQRGAPTKHSTAATSQSCPVCGESFQSRQARDAHYFKDLRFNHNGATNVLSIHSQVCAVLCGPPLSLSLSISVSNCDCLVMTLVSCCDCSLAVLVPHCVYPLTILTSHLWLLSHSHIIGDCLSPIFHYGCSSMQLSLIMITVSP
jgi:hypothetical protein